jgi:alkyl hydroperoxide reductase subunit AhpF
MMLGQMLRPVEWLLIGQADHLRSDLSQRLAEELCALDPAHVRISAQMTDLPGQQSRIRAKYRIEHDPTWILLNHQGRAAGVRFIGLPSGYQFAVLLNAMIDVSRSRLMVEPKTYHWCQGLNDTVELLVMATPTCPHSPRMANLAQRLALSNPRRVRTAIVDATGFPEWAGALGLKEVPFLRASTPHRLREPLDIVGTVSENSLVEQLNAWQTRGSTSLTSEREAPEAAGMNGEESPCK